MPFPAAEVNYPNGDGRYLSQGKVHLTTVSQLFQAARQHWNPREHTALSHVLIYCKEGLNTESVAQARGVRDEAAREVGKGTYNLSLGRLEGQTAGLRRGDGLTPEQLVAQGARGRQPGAVGEYRD